MADELLDALESIEQLGWRSLCDGTAAEFYGQLMTSDGAMVLAEGQVLTRDEVVRSLREAPTWDDYRIERVRLVTAGRESAALVYQGTGLRDGQPAFVAWMSSVYVRLDGAWRLALYAQTPVPAT